MDTCVPPAARGLTPLSKIFQLLFLWRKLEYDSGMETDEDDNVHVGGNGNGPWVCVPIDEHYEMSYQPGNFVQDPAPMNHPNINATPVDYFDYSTTDQENNLNLIDKLVTETNRYAEQSIQQPISAHSRMNKMRIMNEYINFT
jgi:hypothetical protein